MSLRNLPIIVAISLLAILAYFPGFNIASGIILMVLVATLGMSIRGIASVLIIIWYFWRFGVFLIAGYAMGRRITTSRIGDAVAVGVIASIGIAIIETAVAGIIRGYHPSGFSLQKAAWVAGTFVLQVACSSVGGWLSLRRR